MPAPSRKARDAGTSALAVRVALGVSALEAREGLNEEGKEKVRVEH